MSFDKAIKYGKTRRKQYRGSKLFDCSCRNHGTCGYCLSNRKYQEIKERLRVGDTRNILKERW